MAKTGEMFCVPKCAGVSGVIVGSIGVECRGRVTAFGSHRRTKGLVATVVIFTG